MIYTLPLEQAEALKEKAILLGSKLGVDHEYSVIREYFKPDGGDRNTGTVMREVHVSDNLMSPSVGEWRVVAVVDHVQRVVINLTDDYKAPRKIVDRQDCDHCGYQRQRNITYMLKHADGREAQVGSSCICEFTGDPRALDCADGAREYAEWASGGLLELQFGEASKGVNLTFFLALAAMVIERHGFVSGRDAYETGGVSTKERTLQALAQYQYYLGSNTDEAKSTRPEERHYEQAKATYDWMLGLPDDDEAYLANLRQIAVNGYVQNSTAGLATSAVIAYQREKERIAYAEVIADSEYVGEVKSRIKFVGKLASVRALTTVYGTTTMYKFLANGKDVVVWFATRDAGLTSGRTYEVEGTVKAHEMYRNIKQTVVTRCKVSQA